MATATSSPQHLPQTFDGLDTTAPVGVAGQLDATARDLARHLAGAIADEVRFDNGSRDATTTHASHGQSQPIGRP